MDRTIKTTTLFIAALTAGALLVAGCEQRGQNTAGGPGEQANSKLMGKNQPGLMGQPEQSAQSGQPGPAGGAGPNPMAQSGQPEQPGAKIAGAVDDSAITAKVKASLLAEPGLKSTQIDVATKDATVTLSGTVPSPTMRDRAKQIAMSTEGVKNVVDKINVKSSA
jgi:predicted small secreted protein